MSYDHKIIAQKYHLKGLVNPDICNQLIKFYEDHKHMAIPEDSYKFDEDAESNKIEEDNCSFLNISELKNEKDFRKTVIDCYKQMCDWLNNNGVKRSSYQTPREFAMASKAHLKISEENLYALTQIFEKARYSTHEISNDEKDWIVVAERVKPFSLTQLRANLTKAKGIAYAKGYMKRHANGRI